MVDQRCNACARRVRWLVLVGWSVSRVLVTHHTTFFMFKVWISIPILFTFQIDGECSHVGLLAWTRHTCLIHSARFFGFWARCGPISNLVLVCILDSPLVFLLYLLWYPFIAFPLVRNLYKLLLLCYVSLIIINGKWRILVLYANKNNQKAIRTTT